MKELSLHILDIVQNSISAGASIVKITIFEDTSRDLLVISVQDNGRGMEKQVIKKVKDPFYTSRTTRRVGLGIPLLEAASKRCGGNLKIYSTPGKGTKVIAKFSHSHIDRAPIGNLWDTISGLIMCNEETDFVYTHIFNGRQFQLNTIDIKKVLEGVPITSPEVINWIRDYLKENIEKIYATVQ